MERVKGNSRWSGRSMVQGVHRLTSWSLVCLCVSACVVLVWAVPVFAAAPEAPMLELTSRNASEVGLRGVLYPNAAGESGTYEFLYKQSSSECEGGGKSASGVASGLSFEEVFETLSGLQPGTQYTVCLALTTVGGTALSAPVSVTTAIAPEPPEASAATAVTATSATLHGVLNPHNPGEAGSYEFLYRRSGSECEGESVTPSTAAAGAQAEAVSAPIAELLAHTTYTFCLRASNEVGEAAVSAPITFTTPAAAPRIEDASVSDVAASAATFSALINPEGAATSYVFEYAPAGGAFAPVAEAGGKGSLPEGSAGVPVSVHVQAGLLAHTAYQFRVVASNSVEAVTRGPVAFTTQIAGPGTELLDGRRWELVSPPDKNGALIEPLAANRGAKQASADGDRISYLTNAPVGADVQGYETIGDTLSTRGATGWQSRDIALPHESAAGTTGGLKNPEYQFFSDDLSSALAINPGVDGTLLSPQASEPTQYIRREGLCDASATAGECYLPLLTGKEGVADVPPGTKFGGFGVVDFEGATPDLGHVALDTKVQLTATPITGFQIYEWSAKAPPAGALQLVSVLPASEGGGPSTLGSEGGEAVVGGDFNQAFSGMRHSISNDGSRVFWGAGGSEASERHLYLRDTLKGETIRLDMQQPGAPPSGAIPGPTFQIASADGSRVYFTDPQPLTEQSGTGKIGSGANSGEDGDLYECAIVEAAGKLSCDLTDLTPATGGLPAEARNMVLGASEDGSFVYFVANGVIPGSGASERGTCSAEAPIAACNLYVAHDGAVTFIASLSREDENDWGGENSSFHNLGLITARVSPDGRYVAFMSDRPLTGYDNHDAVSGKADEEVFLYDSASRRLACVSCDPTGARPTGVEAPEGAAFEGDFADIVPATVHVASSNWVAANLSGGSGLSDKGEALYQPRLLSDGGRLFFNSSDSLVPGDVNGTEDVYEFEPQGYEREGRVQCSASSPSFGSSSGGCVSLISSGTSPEESGFLDASASGADVFFLTSSSLVAADRDTAYDVYDAHECSPGAPCVSPTVSPPACDTGDACKPAPSPQPGVFGAPASSTFSGPGNLAASPPGKPVVVAKPLTRAQKLKRALRGCAKKPKRKRKACVGRARRRFGAKPARTSVRATGKARG